MLSKWLATRPRVLILDEPTQGIDVQTKAEVHAVIADLARQGLAIILISSELPELLGMCDRIMVLREGRITAELPAAEATQERVLYAMTDAAGAAAGPTRHAVADPVPGGAPRQLAAPARRPARAGPAAGDGRRHRAGRGGQPAHAERRQPERRWPWMPACSRSSPSARCWSS